MNKHLPDLVKEAKAQIKKDEDLIVLSIVSGLLAGFAIHLNNDFILLGSMLIAPFLNSMISIGIFLFSGKFKDLGKALSSLLLISLLVFVANFLLTKTFPMFSIQAEITYETVFYFDYFIVATLLGFVGVLLWLWPSMPLPSAGLSVAISIVPPLANSGRLLAEGNIMEFKHSLLVFSLNLVGVLLGCVIGLGYKVLLSDKQKADNGN